MISLV
jgi:hypothetical protein